MDIRQLFFKNRSYTPIPLVLLLLFFSKPYQPIIYFGFVLLTIGEIYRVWAVRYAGVEHERQKWAHPNCVHQDHWPMYEILSILGI